MLTIRYALADDEAALHDLAALDSQRLPGGPLLLAEVGGELWAAVQLSGEVVIADPFRRTADVVSLLRVRAGQLRGVQPPPGVAGRLLLPACPEPRWFGARRGGPLTPAAARRRA